MKRASIALALLALLLSACGSPKKACRRAQGYMHKAVLMCPEMAQLHTDTVVITLPGDSVQGTLTYAPAEVQRILAACDSLAKANTTHDTTYIERRVVQLRRQACTVEPLNIDRPDMSLHVWQDKLTGRLQYTAQLKPRTVEAPHTVPQIIAGPVVVSGTSIPWYMWVLVGALCILSTVLYLLMDHFRFHDQQIP